MIKQRITHDQAEQLTVEYAKEMCKNDCRDVDEFYVDWDSSRAHDPDYDGRVIFYYEEYLSDASRAVHFFFDVIED